MNLPQLGSLMVEKCVYIRCGRFFGATLHWEFEEWRSQDLGKAGRLVHFTSLTLFKWASNGQWGGVWNSWSTHPKSPKDKVSHSARIMLHFVVTADFSDRKSSDRHKFLYMKPFSLPAGRRPAWPPTLAQKKSLLSPVCLNWGFSSSPGRYLQCFTNRAEEATWAWRRGLRYLFYCCHQKKGQDFFDLGFST